MSATLHRIYQSKALVLTKTMVMKLHNVALAINEDLKLRGYVVDETDPSTWKYYLNLNGEYHQADHDKLLELSDGQYDHIRIKVAGENQPEEVNFTKALLFGDSSDMAVANEYRFNTNYYNSLVTRYPDFEDLIRGVLNPVPQDIALASYEGEILYCGGYLKTRLPTGIFHMIRQDYGPLSENYLIETNEENLIPSLQEHINAYFGRYENVNYTVSHDLFYHMLLGLLYMSIPGTLEAIRMHNAHHPLGFTHSFHIRQYLDSMGNLGWVVDHISKKEQLWLYRNLRWLDANRGKQMTFKAIVDNILTPSNIPLSGHRLQHDLFYMEEDDVWLPKPYMQKETININHVGSGADYREIAEIIDKEAPLAVENIYDPEGQVSRVTASSALSMYDNVNTKVLESTVIDLTNHVAFTMEDIALNMWLFTASYGYYRGTVIVTHPLTSDRVQLTPMNAYILSLYCLNKGWANYEMDTIPSVDARLIPRVANWKPFPTAPDKPTLADMQWGTLANNITESEILDIMGSYVPSFNHNSANSLNAEITRQHKEIMRKYFTYCRIEDRVGRAHGEWVAHHQYWYDIPCELVDTPTNYQDWLISHGIDLNGLTRRDYVTLGLSLIEAATGIDLSASEKLKNKQSAVLSILRHFTSYTIQIIQDVVAVDSYLADFKTLRIANDKAKIKSAMKVKIPLWSVDGKWSLKEGTIWLSTMHVIPDLMVKEKFSSHDKIHSKISIRDVKEAQRGRVKMPYVTIIDADIPDIVVDTRVKVFGDINSVRYPTSIVGDITSAQYPTPSNETLSVTLSTDSIIQQLANDSAVSQETNTAIVLATSPQVSLKSVMDDQESVHTGVGLTSASIVQEP